MLELEIDFDAIIQFAKQLGLADRIIREEMIAGMEASLMVVVDGVQGYTPWNIGTLSQSIAGEVHGQPPDFFGLVTTPLPYGWAVEKGRRPGKMPPIAPLEFWCRRKRVRFVKEGKQLSYTDTAWIIAKAIAAGRTQFQRKGGARMFEQGFKVAEPLVLRIWQAVPGNIVARLVKKGP